MKIPLCVRALIILLSPLALAWNPTGVHNGSPQRWNTTSAVVWNPDGGVLGKLTNAQATAMVAAEFQKWEDVTTAVIDYSQGAQIVDPGTGLATDVTSANYAAVINADDGQNPIIFDNDRDIFTMLGIPQSVAGIAAPLVVSGATITKGYAVLQGDWFDDEPVGTPPEDPGEVTEQMFRGLMVHEFGHFGGLHHTSVNRDFRVVGLPGCPPATLQQIETMSPVTNSDSLTLEHDDQVGISTLYPAPAFGTDFAVLRGTLVDRDGVSGFAGANIVLRRDTADCDQLYDLAQAMQSGAAPAEFGGPASFSFDGLTPAGSYTIRATTIQDGFSYLITPPISLGGPDDYYNGADEDWFSPPDDPSEVGSVIAPAAGQTTAGLDIRINNSGGPGQVLATLFVDPIEGGAQEEQALDDDELDSAGAFGGTSQAAWINRFTPGPADYPLDVEGVDLMFWHATTPVGRDIRILVYADPAGTGDPANAVLVHQQDEQIQFLSTVTFNSFDLATPVRINAGEYYVGAYDLVADVDANFIMSVDLDTPSGRAYNQPDSTAPAGYALQPAQTWMTRARVRSVAPPGSVRLTWDLPCNDLSVPDQDFAVYEGSVAALRAAALDHAAIACDNGGATSYDVLGPADDRYWLVGPVLASREGSLGTGALDRTPAASCQTIDPDSCM